MPSHPKKGFLRRRKPQPKVCLLVNYRAGLDLVRKGPPGPSWGMGLAALVGEPTFSCSRWDGILFVGLIFHLVPWAFL